MVKHSDECWHVLIHLPDGQLFDGGVGVHDEDRYKDKFEIEDMLEFDFQRLEKRARFGSNISTVLSRFFNGCCFGFD